VKPEAFISHATRNQREAQLVLAALEREGVRCWIAPRDIPAGREWAEAIEEAVSATSLIVAMVSRAALDSPEVARELALASRARILAVRIEDVQPTGSLRYFLATAQWMDAFAPSFDAHLERIVPAARRLLGEASAAEPVEEPAEAVGFQPAAKALLGELSTGLSGFQDRCLRLLAVLGEPSRVIVQNEEAHRTLVRAAESFNAFSPPFISSLPAFVSGVRTYWGPEWAKAAGEIRRMAEEVIYRGGIWELNDLRAQLNDLAAATEIEESTWRAIDAAKAPRLDAIRAQVADLTNRWVQLEGQLEAAL
jgi:hypothetical protein